MDKSRIHFVLVAGFSSDHLEALKVKGKLEDIGFSANAISFYGKEYRDNFSGMTAAECIGNVSEVINDACEKYAAVFGVGISLGGSFLLEHAKRHNNLKGIVGIGVPFKLRKTKLLHLGQKFLPIILLIWNHLQKIKKLRLSPIGAANTVIEYLEGEALKNLAEVKTPILFIHSKKDPVSDYQAIPEFLNIISSTQKKIIFFENGNHVVNHDFNSMMKHTLDFFDIS
jgi:esterase/lipase